MSALVSSSHPLCAAVASQSGEDVHCPHQRALGQRVIRFADGDCEVPRRPQAGVGTVIVRFVDGTAEKARLIGVDTPETVHSDEPNRCYGVEAFAHIKRRLLDANIAIAADREDHDRYGRLLVYPWLESGEFFNRTLIAEGYEIEKHYAPNTRNLVELHQFESEARAARRGRWTACPLFDCSVDLPITLDADAWTHRWITVPSRTGH